jgi:hypothetical protein
MVVFGCGAGVKGLATASRQDGMVFHPCRAALDDGVDEDQERLPALGGNTIMRA